MYRTIDFLANTSLASPSFPCQRATPWQRRQRAQAEIQRRHAREAREQEEDERMRWRRITYAREQQRNLAHRLGTFLREHYTLLPALETTMNDAAVRFKTAAQQDAELARTYVAFEHHCDTALLASRFPVRRLEIVLWFGKGLPDDLQTAIEQLASHHHKAAYIRSKLHTAEVKSKGWSHATCNEHDFCQRDDEVFAAVHLDRPFGMGPEQDENGFTDYTRPTTSEADVQHLRANFEVRRTWLQHAPTHMRFSFGELEENDWEESMDGRMVDFIDTALRATKQREIKHDVRVESTLEGRRGQWKAEMKRKVQHLVALRVDTGRDMREYRRSLEDRGHRLRAARRSLGITQQIVAANAGFSTVTEARGYIREVDEHNDTLADGVGIEAERVDLGPSIVMLLDEAYEYIDRSRT